MAKNKVSPTEIRPKKNNFFKKAKPTTFTTQALNPIDKSRNNSKETNNFLIKKINNATVSTIPKSSKNKEENVKKPFDKKKWRLQKYSNKYKLQQWEESRKKVLLKEYHNQAKHDPSPKIDVQKIYEEEEKKNNSIDIDELENENNLNSEVSTDNLESTKNKQHPKKRKPYSNTYEEYQRLKEEKIKRKEELRTKKEERDKALKEYKKEKTQKYRKLNKKTKKGQPVMKYRMEMLLEQIQKTTT